MPEPTSLPPFLLHRIGSKLSIWVIHIQIFFKCPQIKAWVIFFEEYAVLCFLLLSFFYLDNSALGRKEGVSLGPQIIHDILVNEEWHRYMSSGTFIWCPDDTPLLIFPLVIMVYCCLPVPRFCLFSFCGDGIKSRASHMLYYWATFLGSPPPFLNFFSFFFETWFLLGFPGWP